MGNRAVIFVEKAINYHDRYVGIYLHWNGSAQSVYGYLEYLKERKVRGGDDPYTRACLIQVIRNFFGGTLSVGVDCYTLKEACNMGSDNGVYVVKWDGDVYSVDRYDRYSEMFTPASVEMEKQKALNSTYWTNTPNIMDAIRTKNGDRLNS